MPAAPVPRPAPTLVTTPAELGAAIRRARQGLGLSYREAAARCRVGRRFFNELENGKPTARLDKVLAVLAGVGLAPVLMPRAPAA